MPSGRTNKALLLFMEDDELDQGSLDFSPKTKPSQPIFKKKELKGKKLNQRKIKIDVDGSEDEAEQVSSLNIQRSKLKIPHQFINKRPAFKSSTDKVITNTNDNDDNDNNNNIKHTKAYLKKLKDQQSVPKDTLMDLDQPVVVNTTPAQKLHSIEDIAAIDDDEGEDYNKIPVDEYESEDNRNQHIKGGGENNFPADDDLMPDSTDAFVDDGPLTLSKTKLGQGLEIDEDLYDIELPMAHEDSDVEISTSEALNNELIEPEDLVNHLQNLKKSIENLKTEKEATEAKCEEIREKLDHIGHSKEQLLIELNL